MKTKSTKQEFNNLVELFKGTRETTSKQPYRTLLGRVLNDPHHDRYPINVCYLGMGLGNKPENKEIILRISQVSWVTQPWHSKLMPLIRYHPEVLVSVSKESATHAKVVITFKNHPRHGKPTKLK